jgi:hypothetical protein
VRTLFSKKRMRTLYLFSHWQTGNSTIQLAVAALIMDIYGFDTIKKMYHGYLANIQMRVFTDANWDATSDFMLQGDDPFYFRETDNLILQGYFQNSNPLVSQRAKILGLFADSRLHFPISQSGATIKDLLEAPAPLQLRDTDIVLHIRLGDYRAARLVADPAPQLAILRAVKPPRLIIVCQKPKTDAERNYLRLFEEFQPIFQHGTELEDFATLRSAKRIILTNSSFSWSAAWLGNANERWIPEPTFNELGRISETDHMYKVNNGYDLSGMDIPIELLPVTGEFLQSLCDYTVLDRAKHVEIGPWIDAVVPLTRQLFIEEEWSVAPKSVFVYPEPGLLETVVARCRPRLIVVHNGDNQVNYEVLIPFLEANPHAYAWIQNNTVAHPRIRSLPIAEQNRKWRGGHASWEPPVSVCRQAERESDFLYTWCSPSHPIRPVWMEEARGLRSAAPNLELYPYRLPKEDYEQLLCDAKAVICPPGNGLDTHRAWETLYKGGWALVQNNQHTRCMLKEYPSLPFIPIESPASLPPPPPAPSPFHPMLLRRFWTTLFESYVTPHTMHESQ